MFAHTAGLRLLAEQDGPFLTFMVPAPSVTADAVCGPEPRPIDRCIKQAFVTYSDIHVVPNVDILDNGAAALLRWQPETRS